MADNLYSTKAAAKYIGLSVAGVKYHIREGNLKGQLVGNSLVFTQDELDNFKSTKRPPGRPKKEQK